MSNDDFRTERDDARRELGDLWAEWTITQYHPNLRWSDALVDYYANQFFEHRGWDYLRELDGPPLTDREQAAIKRHEEKERRAEQRYVRQQSRNP